MVNIFRKRTYGEGGFHKEEDRKLRIGVSQEKGGTSLDEGLTFSCIFLLNWNCSRREPEAHCGKITYPRLSVVSNPSILN